jgi:hypothetical protein
LSSAMPVPGALASAEGGIRAESQRVKEGVVDAAVENVDLLVAFGGAHRDVAVDHAQILPLDQFHAHLVSQEGMLEIGRIIEPRCQHRHGGRTRDARRLHCRQRLAQELRIVLDRQDIDFLEQLREELHHGLAVLQHVGHARGRAGIVLQNVELVLAGPHDVDADNVRIDAGGRANPDHLGQESLVLRNELLRNSSCAENFLAVVDVVEKGVERLHPLFDALREAAPFRAGDDPRHDVEGDKPLGRLLLAIDGKGDAGLAEDAFGVAHLLGQSRRVLGVQPVIIRRVRSSQPGIFRAHLVERNHRITPLQAFEWKGPAEIK